ncbi:hypothetical protein ACPWSR_12875 [Alloiococcus sp. CFN-8]|uniref:hypothetical protein n=1 Tax=Alloiococcus sp. CFN-8 TaxID=3416081 RepID=UPI003CEF91AD
MSKTNKNQSSKWPQRLMIGLFMVMGGVCGIFIARYLMDMSDGQASLREIIYKGVLLFISVYIAIFLQIILHEGGHLVFGLITGYKFSSFRIGSLMWIKIDGRLRLRRLSIAGTGGQCLMVPPEFKNGRIPFVLYNFGGSIMNLIISGIFGALYFIFPRGGSLSIFFLMITIIGIAFALMNGIPLSLGTVDNDGYNALSMGNNPDSLRAFYVQMKINEQITKGVRLKDMPQEWFVIPSEEAMKNSMVASLGVFACNRLMDSMDFIKAEETMKKLLELDTGILGLHRSLMMLDLVYCEVINENRPEVLDKLLGKSEKQIMKVMKSFPSILRTQYAYALLAEKDAQKAEELKLKFEKIAMSYPHPSEITAEGELMDYALKLYTTP